MRAAVLTGIEQMEIREVPTPRPERPGEVLVRIAGVGVCGSDVHYYLRGRIGSQVVEYPFTVGHECAGTVADIGPAVTRVKPGDRVAIDPAMPCWACDQCIGGRSHTCRSLRFLGCPGQADGSLCEFIVMPQESCYPLGETTSMDQAVVAEPLSVGLYATRLAALTPAAAVGILGCGPIGLSALMCARAEGAVGICVTDKIQARLAVAVSAGADWARSPDDVDVVEQILQMHPAGLDVVFECCGGQDALDQAVKLLKPGGKLMLIGIPAVERVSFDPDLLRRHELCIQNVRRQVDAVQPALDLIEGGTVPVDAMLTHSFSFEATKDAFDLVASYHDGVVKAVVRIDENAG